MHRPAFAKPSGTLLVGLQAEPVVASFFVVLHVLYIIKKKKQNSNQIPQKLYKNTQQVHTMLI